MTDAHTTRTLYDRLIAEGFEPSADARRLYGAMTTAATPDELLDVARAQLKTALLSGDAALIATAQAAVTEAGNIQGAWDSFRSLRADYSADLLKTIADPAFAHVRAVYDKAGARFMKAIATVDPDAVPGALMSKGTPQERAAWPTIPALIAWLDHLAELLGDVLKCCGRTPYTANYVPGKPGFPLGLLTTPGDADPKLLMKVWTWMPYRPERVNPKGPSAIDRLCSGTNGDGTSWGRGGKWAAVVRLGATLAVPCKGLDDYAPLSDGKKRETIGLDDGMRRQTIGGLAARGRR